MEKYKHSIDMYVPNAYGPSNTHVYFSVYLDTATKFTSGTALKAALEEYFKYPVTGSCEKDEEWYEASHCDSLGVHYYNSNARKSDWISWGRYTSMIDTVTGPFNSVDFNNPVQDIQVSKNGTISPVFRIKKRDDTYIWTKAKPVFCNFDETKFNSISASSGGGDYEIHKSGDAMYLDAFNSWEIEADVKEGYSFDQKGQIIDLEDPHTLSKTAFDAVTYNFTASALTSTNVTIPALTTYISSANVSYTFSGVNKVAYVASTPETIAIDLGTTVSYINVVPVSGWAASIPSAKVFSSSGSMDSIKVFLKAPEVTSTVVRADTGYYFQNKIYNPNPIECHLYCNRGSSSVGDPQPGLSEVDIALKAFDNYNWTSTITSRNSSYYIKALISFDDSTYTSSDFDLNDTEIVSISSAYNAVVVTVNVPILDSTKATSAKFNYISNGQLYTMMLSTTAVKQVTADRNSKCWYSDIVAKSGYIVPSEEQSYTITSTSYTVPSLIIKLTPQEPTITGSVNTLASGGKVYKITSIKNPNNFAITVYFAATNDGSEPGNPFENSLADDTIVVGANKTSTVSKEIVSTSASSTIFKIKYGIASGDSSYGSIIVTNNIPAGSLQISNTSFEYSNDDRIVIKGYNQTNISIDKLGIYFYVYNGTGEKMSDIGQYFLADANIGPGKTFVFQTSIIDENAFGYSCTAEDIQNLFIELDPYYHGYNVQSDATKTYLYGSKVKDDAESTTTTAMTPLGNEESDSHTLTII